jgi:isoleucyl-tRNA synthetase
MYNKVVNMLWNVVTFYELYDDKAPKIVDDVFPTSHDADKFILRELHETIGKITEKMDANKIEEASRPIMDFINILSTEYLQLVRDRFKVNSNDDPLDSVQAAATMREVLFQLSLIMAPFTPFVAEKIYQELKKRNVEWRKWKDSVHLEDWPVQNQEILEKYVESYVGMKYAIKVIAAGRSLRKQSSINVRQPLSELECAQLPVAQYTAPLVNKSIEEIVRKALNVKEIKAASPQDINRRASEGWAVCNDAEFTLALNVVEITDELKREGLVREIVRTVNQMRKDAGLTIQDRIVLKYRSSDEMLAGVFTEFADDIRTQVLADRLEDGGEVVVAIDGRQVHLSIEKV